MDKETNGHLYIANDNLKRIADALEEILRLVKADQEASAARQRQNDNEQETRLGEYPGPPEPLAMAQGPGAMLQAASGKLQASSSKLDKETL